MQTLKGTEITEFIKDKNRSLNIYGANILFILTTNLKFLFVNLDTIYTIPSPKLFASTLLPFEHIYGQQNDIVRSKLVPITDKHKQYLAKINEFRRAYINKHLQTTFENDTLAQSYINSKTRKKLPKELASDLEIQCSLNFNQGVDNLLQVPLALLLTVDTSHKVRVYAIFNDQCELLFDYQITFKNEDDYATSIDIYLKSMIVLVTSKQEQNFIITPNLKQTRIFKDLQIPISKLHINDVHHELVLSGLSSGELLINQPAQILNNEFQDLVRPQ